jgi:hypothetical protein
VAAVDQALMEQLVSFPTQVRGNILDLLLTNMPDRVSEVRGCGRLGTSDHEIIFAEISCGGGRQTEAKKTKNWRRADWPQMRKELSRVNWRREFTQASPSQMWQKFKIQVQATVKKNVPLKKIHKNGRPPWMTREISAAIQRKKRLWQEAKKGRRHEEYKEAEKKVRNLIRNAKNRFEKRLADSKDGNSRPFFSYVKKKSKSRPEVGPLTDKHGATVTEDEKMAGILNNYFSSVFTQENVTDLPKASTLQVDAPLTSVPITAHEVKKKIKNLRKEAAAGPDEIGPRILQELVEEVAEPLVMIFRASMSTYRRGTG